MPSGVVTSGSGEPIVKPTFRKKAGFSFWSENKMVGGAYETSRPLFIPDITLVETAQRGTHRI